MSGYDFRKGHRGFCTRGGFCRKFYDDDYDVLHEGAIVGRILHTGVTTPGGNSWFWGLVHSYRKDRKPAHGYEPTRVRQWPHWPKVGGGSRRRVLAPLVNDNSTFENWYSGAL